jgi:Zn-dependent peptidase ImmA (M78 family)
MSREDIKANRFAAELLISEEVFRNELSIRKINKDSIDLSEVIELMDVFLVPSKTLVRRLYEIDYITKNTFEEFMSKEDRNEEQGIMLLQKRLGLCKRNNDRTKEIKLDKLVDTALNLYEKSEITYEKLEYLLSLSKFKPSDFNIHEEECYIAPEDEI